MSHVDGATAGAALRRRERRLRMHWRHEQLSLQMLLATFQHHSSRGQTTARSGEGFEVKYTAKFPEHTLPRAASTPAVGGSRPDRLYEVRPQERVLRRTVEQNVGVFTFPVLDAPVPQMVDQLVDVLKIFDRGLTEQVVEVPKVSLQDVVPHRAAPRAPQLRNSWGTCPCQSRSSWHAARAHLASIGARLHLREGGYWWQTGTRNTRSDPPRRGSPTAQGGI